MIRNAFTLGIVLTGLLANGGAPRAQTFGGAFDGMSNSKDPITIFADKLEVADDKGTAEFSGNVEVTQGSTNLKAKKLLVVYSKDAQGKAGPGGNVKRIEASGGRVAVRSKDQEVSADTAMIDMDTQIATLSGDVVVSQGENIITGCSVTINMKTNDISVDKCKGSKSRERVQLQIDPSTDTKQKQ